MSLLPPLRLLALLAALALSGARAASVTITVHGADGQAAPNVVVQLLPAHAPAAARPASAPAVVISQKDVHFVPYVTAVVVGSTVRFANQDPFDHHLRSESAGPSGDVPPAKDFEFRLAAAGAGAGKASSAEVKLDKPGLIVLGCHLHGSMRGHLFVSETPFVGVTDADGRVTVADVPDGEAELRLWHPDQLTAQVSSPRRIAGPAQDIAAGLDFTPAKPRARRS